MFSNQWHSENVPTWDKFFDAFDASKVLEIGSYEGQSACWLIDKLAARHPLEIHCVDRWDSIGAYSAGLNPKPGDMDEVEQRFNHNLDKAILSAPHPVTVGIHRGESWREMMHLIVQLGAGYFDFIYIDGSHLAFDVLTDAVLAFKLLRPGGFMCFDDYIWGDGSNFLASPKLGIDGFVNAGISVMFKVLPTPCTQVFLQKVCE